MAKNEIGNELLKQAGQSLMAQNHQRDLVENQLFNIESTLQDLSLLNFENLDNLDELILQAESLFQKQEINMNLVTQDDIDYGLKLIELTEKEKSSIKVIELETIDTINVNDDISWDEYLENLDNYSEKNNIDLTQDPFESLMTAVERAEISERIRSDYVMKKAHCDKYDYLIASFCGVGAGLIDSFFVGMPTASKLGDWTDKQTDNLVEKFSKKIWEVDKKNGATTKKEPQGIASAIGYLEERFRVNYDARYDSDLQQGNGIKMSASNHHLKSLAHSPDLIGLFFSVLDQFTGKASFVNDGHIIRLRPTEKSKEFILEGSNFLAKLFCGFCNWMGHVMSDIAGSSGTRGHVNGRRGAGVPIPFFEMFQFCDFGSFNVNGSQKNLAELMASVFESGYDARHGAAMAIPVVLNELLIRLLWALKSRFYHKNSWKESIPFGEHPELRRMLVVGHGALCLVDGADAAIRSRGNVLGFALHLNVVAWSRFAFASLQEARSLYKEDCLDIVSMDRDFDLEWSRLYGEI